MLHAPSLWTSYAEPVDVLLVDFDLDWAWTPLKHTTAHHVVQMWVHMPAAGKQRQKYQNMVTPASQIRALGNQGGRNMLPGHLSIITLRMTS